MYPISDQWVKVFLKFVLCDRCLNLVLLSTFKIKYFPNSAPLL